MKSSAGWWASASDAGIKRLADLPDAELTEAHPDLGPGVAASTGSRQRDQGVPVLWLDRRRRRWRSS